LILLDEMVHIVYGSHPGSSYPSIPCDHLTLCTRVSLRSVLGSPDE
jgi:hypothetical protein